MPQDPVSRFDEWVWEDVRSTDYPSPRMLDRLERNLRGPDEAREYVDLLIDKAGEDYKSPTMMARAERVARALRLFEELQEAASQR